MITSAALFLVLGQGKFVPPYVVVANPPTLEVAQSLLGDKPRVVRIDGETLTIAAHGEKNPISLPDWLNIPMVQIPNTDIWIGQATMKNWNEAFFSYYIPDGEKRVTERFFGPKAPKVEEAQGKLQGTVVTRDFMSKALGEERSFSVYTPPGAKKGIPAVYAADGVCEAYARLLEPLILAKKMRPVAIVGIYSGGYRGDRSKPFEMEFDFRAKEYLKMFDADRYGLHLKFVCDEVVPMAEKEFGLGAGQKNRALTGFSNGGAFALTASVDRPEMFSTIMPFSIAAFDSEKLLEAGKGKKLPRYLVAAGTLEVFSRGSQRATDNLRAMNAKVDYDLYQTGHEWEMWKIAFARSMQKTFPLK